MPVKYIIRLNTHIIYASYMYIACAICTRMRIWAHANVSACAFELARFKIRMVVSHTCRSACSISTRMRCWAWAFFSHAFKNKRVRWAHASGRFLQRMRHVTRMPILACALWNLCMLVEKRCMCAWEVT